MRIELCEIDVCTEPNEGSLLNLTVLSTDLFDVFARPSDVCPFLVREPGSLKHKKVKRNPTNVPIETSSSTSHYLSLLGAILPYGRGTCSAQFLPSFFLFCYNRPATSSLSFRLAFLSVSCIFFCFLITRVLLTGIQFLLRHLCLAAHESTQPEGRSHSKR